ncbi:MAG: hypothetical protein JWO38_5378, partial [Gemmataceae bacterium]|nr:hypothetical protein [Gemmataceae bacterium]
MIAHDVELGNAADVIARLKRSRRGLRGALRVCGVGIGKPPAARVITSDRGAARQLRRLPPRNSTDSEHWPPRG